MKKALALGAFALAMALPLVSSASSITTSFVGSSTGTDTINISDTITFGITVHLDIGSTYPAHGLTMSGDVANTNVDNPLTHDLTLQTVTGITVNPAFGVNFVDWSGTFTQILGTNDTNSGHFARYTAVDVAAAPLGATGPALIGTVTIHASSAGVYLGGGTIVGGIDTLGNDGAATISNPYQYTVVPEPGTAMLMLLGLGGLGVMGRKNR